MRVRVRIAIIDFCPPGSRTPRDRHCQRHRGSEVRFLGTGTDRGEGLHAQRTGAFTWNSKNLYPISLEYVVCSREQSRDAEQQ
jgi:hypothetical protein